MTLPTFQDLMKPALLLSQTEQYKRTKALADTLLENDECPAEALVRLAKFAESEGKTNLAIDAWKAVLPYVHPKPKAIETAPDVVAELARSIAEARTSAVQQIAGTSFAERIAALSK